MGNQNFIELVQDATRTRTCINKSSIVSIESNGSNCFVYLLGGQPKLTVKHTYEEIMKKL